MDAGNHQLLVCWLTLQHIIPSREHRKLYFTNSAKKTGVFCFITSSSPYVPHPRFASFSRPASPCPRVPAPPRPTSSSPESASPTSSSLFARSPLVPAFVWWSVVSIDRAFTWRYWSCRCVQIFKTVRLIRRIHVIDPDNTQRYRLYISQLQDLSTLGVVEAFTEEAPQVRVCHGQRYWSHEAGGE